MTSLWMTGLFWKRVHIYTFLIVQFCLYINSVGGRETEEIETQRNILMHKFRINSCYFWAMKYLECMQVARKWLQNCSDFQLYLYGIKAAVVTHHPTFSKQSADNQFASVVTPSLLSLRFCSSWSFISLFYGCPWQCI